MAFIRTVPPHAADGAVAAMYERQQSSWGYVPNYAKVFSHRPEVLARWGQLLAEIKRPMDLRRFELVTFAAAHELRHTACALAHGRKLQQWFGEAEILAIAAGRSDGVLDAAEQAMLRFAREVARDATQVDAAQVRDLRAHGFTDGEVFDIAATAAGRAFFTKLLDALGVEADASVLAMPAALREPLMLGRGIDARPCVTMPEAAAEAAAR